MNYKGCGISFVTRKTSEEAQQRWLYDTVNALNAAEYTLMRLNWPTLCYEHFTIGKMGNKQESTI